MAVDEWSLILTPCSCITTECFTLLTNCWTPDTWSRSARSGRCPPPLLCPHWWITRHHAVDLTPSRRRLFSFMEMRPAQIDEEKTEDDFPNPAAAACCSASLCCSLFLFFFFSLALLLLKVGTSNPLLNLLNGARPIYQLTHFRWIIYPFILPDNAADVTRGWNCFFLRGVSDFLFHWREQQTPWLLCRVMWPSENMTLVYCCAAAERTVTESLMLHGGGLGGWSLWELLPPVFQSLYVILGTFHDETINLK